MTAIASSNSFSPPQQQQNGFSDRDESADSMDTTGQEENHNDTGGMPSQNLFLIRRPPKWLIWQCEQAEKWSHYDEEDNIPWDQRMQQQAAKRLSIPRKPLSSKSGQGRTINVQAQVRQKKKKRQESDQEESEEDYEPEDDDEDDYQPKKKKSKAVDTPKSELKIKIKREIKRDSVTPEKPSSSKHKVTAVKKTKKEIKKKSTVLLKRSGRRRWWKKRRSGGGGKKRKKEDGIKWKTLEHKGPLFAPPYEPLPKSVKFLYDGKEMHLSEAAEEVAEVFNTNFFKDFRKVMTPAEREKITDLTKCNFKQMHAHFLSESEKRKAMSKEQKLKIKEEKEAEAKEYGHAFIDGHKQKIGNFRIEPPGLFRGRGDHPKMGRLKRRIQPEDVIINCGKSSKAPVPPPGHKWKEIRHDNTVTWLCGWTPKSRVKKTGEIRRQYTIDFKAREMRIRQRAVALYFIDKLALRAGNEKDTDEAADTVGCCSLRCEHVKLLEESDGQKFVVVFDFLGKDSIRYFNQVPVEKQVFKNLKIFMEGKEQATTYSTGLIPVV
uniref:DNA topoisomerase 1 n=1 Tax=Ditylenchus dipsaci TaxID=166011 RepID=A0A915EHW0_9BILA